MLGFPSPQFRPPTESDWVNAIRAPSYKSMMSKQPGAWVYRYGDSEVEKIGDRVRPAEEVALRLVRQHTNVPVPTVYSSYYNPDNADENSIRMSFLKGITLDKVWEEDDGDESIKESICRQIWQHIYDFRRIPKPPKLHGYFQCSADGSSSCDVLLQPLQEHLPGPFASDAELRNRIYERYISCGGRKYFNELPMMLPHSDKTVFTHGDIAPRNIMVAEENECPIVGIFDWENAGWYPDYWEYANMMKPSGDENWQMWMRRTAPEVPDISGIDAARRVLF